MAKKAKKKAKKAGKKKAKKKAYDDKKCENLLQNSLLSAHVDT